MALILVTVASLLPLVSACHRVRMPETDPASLRDSLRGTIAVVGTDIDHRVVIRVQASEINLVADSTNSNALTRLAGVETVVWGELTKDQRSLNVSNFIAVRVNGIEVLDGYLERNGTTFYLRTNQGRRRVANPPEAFSSLVSARIWVSGPLDSGPYSYGIIVPVSK